MTFRALLLFWDASFNGSIFGKYAHSCVELSKHKNQPITLIAADKQLFIKLFHAAVDVILVTAKGMDAKDVTRNKSS